MAEITTSVEVSIERSPDDVFNWVIDPDNRRLWMNGVKSSEWIRRYDSDVIRVDDRWQDVYEYAGKENLIVMEVDECDPRERVFRFHTAEGKYPIRVRYSLQDLEGSTLFRMTLTGLSDSAVTAFMFKFLGFALKPMMRRQYRKEIDEIRVILESRA